MMSGEEGLLHFRKSPCHCEEGIGRVYAQICTFGVVGHREV